VIALAFVLMLAVCEPQLTRAPSVIEGVLPEYPAGEVGSAEVGLVLTLDIAGGVTAVEVVESGGEAFDRAAVAAGWRLRFSPAEVDGAASAVRIAYRMRFVGTVVTATVATATVPAFVPVPEPATFEVHVVARADNRARTFSIDREESRRLPGTQGDSVKVIQMMPAVSRPALGSSAISVWGAAPEETLVSIDGVEVPFLYHLGGLRSILPSELIDRVALTPAGQGASFGRGVGGIIEVDTRPLDATGVQASVSGDLFDVGGWLTAPASDRVRVAGSARQSVIQALVPAFSSSHSIVPIPNYRDFAAVMDYDLGSHERLDVMAAGALDRLDRRLPVTDPSRQKLESVSQDMGWVRARWSRELDGVSARVVPSAVISRREQSITADDVTAREAVREVRIGLRADRQHLVADSMTLTLGIDAQALFASVERRGSLTIPAREGDPAIFGRTPGDAINVDSWSSTVVDVAPFASLELSLGPLTITPGVRLDLYAITISRITPRVGQTPSIGGARLVPVPVPRLAMRWEILSSLLEMTAAVGLYSQPPETSALSSTFGNPLLEVAHAAHGTATLAWSPFDRLVFELSGFARTASGLSARSASGTPRPAEVLTSSGEGRAAGGQILLRRTSEGDGAFGWISYTGLRAERRASPELAWRRADFDRSHALSAVLGYVLEPWSFSTRLRWTSGAPTTRVTSRYYDARRDEYVPLVGPVNVADLPAFFQLDARVDRTFVTGPMEILLSLEIQNVTTHDNVEAVAYRQDYLETEEVVGLPFFAIFGAKVSL